MVKQRSSCLQQQQKVKSKSNKTDFIDREIMGYINNSKEIEIKKALWEFMYKDHLTPKSLKPKIRQSIDKKKSKVVVKESEKKPAARSSKVDYDMLEKLLEKDDKENQEGNNVRFDKSDSREASERVEDVSECNAVSGDEFGDFDGGMCFENEEDGYGDQGDFDDDDDDFGAW